MLPACFYTICSSILEVKEQQEQHFHPICSIYLQYPCWVNVLFGTPVQSHFGPDPGSRGLEPPAESVIISCCSYSLLTAFSAQADSLPSKQNLPLRSKDRLLNPPAESGITSWDDFPSITSSRQRASLPDEVGLASCRRQPCVH